MAEATTLGLPQESKGGACADLARIHTRTMREEDYGERGKLRALSGVEDLLRIALGASKPST